MTPLWMRNVQAGCRGLFYHKSGVREKSLSGEGERRSETECYAVWWGGICITLKSFCAMKRPSMEGEIRSVQEQGRPGNGIHMSDSWRLFSSAEYPVARYGDEGGENPP